MPRCFHLVLSLAFLGCAREAPAPGGHEAKPEAPPSSPAHTGPGEVGGTPAAAASAVPAPPTYGWLGGKPPTSTLDARFAPPTGATRVPTPTGSFAAFLRTLPLAPEGTPVRSYAGGLLHAADHPNVAAVADLDIGSHDLQQCADSVIRLHAEWRWSLGKAQETRYHGGGGLVLAFDAYVKGDRLVVEGGAPKLSRIAKQRPVTHELHRAWLDEVFGWANTGSLATEAAKVPLEQLRPGDFFVMPGAPFGHAVLVLDLATGPRGARQVLVGQGFMPAQSFHVLRDHGTAWFPVDPAAGALSTPFWKPFPWSALRRLD